MAISTCKNCGTEFKFFPSQSKGIYCCNKCQGEDKVKMLYESGDCSWQTARNYFAMNTEYKCSCCGIAEWNNKPLTLQVDHIDGDRNNNTMENLRYLCPNCHTQTDTWGVKNIADENRHKLRTNLRSGSSAG